MEAATLAEDEATSTNFTCGSHFYEEVEDTKVRTVKSAIYGQCLDGHLPCRVPL